MRSVPRKTVRGNEEGSAAMRAIGFVRGKWPSQRRLWRPLKTISAVCVRGGWGGRSSDAPSGDHSDHRASSDLGSSSGSSFSWGRKTAPGRIWLRSGKPFVAFDKMTCAGFGFVRGNVNPADLASFGETASRRIWLRSGNRCRNRRGVSVDKNTARSERTPRQVNLCCGPIRSTHDCFQQTGQNA